MVNGNFPKNCHKDRWIQISTENKTPIIVAATNSPPRPHLHQLFQTMLVIWIEDLIWWCQRRRLDPVSSIPWKGKSLPTSSMKHLESGEILVHLIFPTQKKKIQSGTNNSLFSAPEKTPTQLTSSKINLAGTHIPTCNSTRTMDLSLGRAKASTLWPGTTDWYHIPQRKSSARDTIVVDVGIKLPYVPNNLVSGCSHDLMYGDIRVHTHLKVQENIDYVSS